MKLPKELPHDREGQYCINCYSDTVHRISRDEKTYYECATCGQVQERSIVIDNAVKWWVDSDGTYWHESVGVVVVNENKQILCLLRTTFPFAYTFPAGHLDIGEEFMDAARRELREETSIAEDTLEKLGEFDICGDSCRRGCDDHRWHLYRVRVPNSIKIELPGDEALEVAWFTFEELKSKNTVYAVKAIIERFGEQLVA